LSAAISRPARLSPDVSPETMKISGSCRLMENSEIAPALAQAEPSFWPTWR
jgi:hypothetical protein